MIMKFGKSTEKKIRGVFEKYEFEVGILKDGVHKDPKRGERGAGGLDVLGEYAGGPVRKTTGKGSKMISEVSKENRERLGFNYLSKPFEDNTAEVVRFLDTFMKYAFGRSQKKRLENTLQACVRNPILRGEYGSESELTQEIKKFSRPMIDTAQLFKAITAAVKEKRS